MTQELRLPPPDRGGPFGLSLPQAATLLVSVGMIIQLMRTAHIRATILYALVALMMMSRIGGVHGYQWTYTLVRFVRVFFKGGFTFRSRAELEGYSLERPKMMNEIRKVVGGRLEFAEFLYNGGGLCLVHNRDTGFASAAFTSRGTDYMSHDEPEQHQFMKAFSDLLDKLGSGKTPVQLYKFTHRTSPATTASTEAFNRKYVDSTCRPGEELARVNLATAQLESVTGATVHDIEQVIGLSSHASLVLKRKHRLAGGGLRNLFDLLLPHINSLTQDLASMDVREVQPLGRKALGLQLERSFGGELKEIDKAELDLREKKNPGTIENLADGLPEYLHMPRHQKYVIVNGRYAKSLYIRGYSRRLVNPQHLAALLNVAGVSRAVTVVARPKRRSIVQHVSDEITISAGEGISDRRRQKNIREKAPSITRAAWLKRRERELSDDYSDWLWSSFITVWADSLDELDSSVELVRQQARDSKLPRIYTMFGWQLEGVLYTSPLGVG